MFPPKSSAFRCFFVFLGDFCFTFVQFEVRLSKSKRCSNSLGTLGKLQQEESMKKNEEVRKQIKSLMEQEITIREIAVRLNIPEGSCRQYVKSMIKEGMIQPKTRQEWHDLSKKSRVKKLYNSLTKEKFVILRDMNYSYEQIAEKFGIPVTTLKSEYGMVPMGRMKLRQKVLKLRKQGKSYRQIANILDRHQGTIARICHILIKKGLLKREIQWNN